MRGRRGPPSLGTWTTSRGATVPRSMHTTTASGLSATPVERGGGPRDPVTSGTRSAARLAVRRRDEAGWRAGATSTGAGAISTESSPGTRPASRASTGDDGAVLLRHLAPTLARRHHRVRGNHLCELLDSSATVRLPRFGPDAMTGSPEQLRRAGWSTLERRPVTLEQPPAGRGDRAVVDCGGAATGQLCAAVRQTPARRRTDQARRHSDIGPTPWFSVVSR